MDLSSTEVEHPPKSRLKRVRTPTMIQMEATECGAVCLGIILAYHKRFVSIEELRTVCSISRDGSSAYNIIQAAKAYGFDCNGYECNLEGLYSVDLPVVIFWNEDHFVVLEGFAKDGVYINDPATGPRKVSYRTFSESFSELVIVFQKTPTFKEGGSHPTFVSLVYDLLKNEKTTLFFSFAMGLCLTLVDLFAISLIKIFFDQFIIEENAAVAFWVIFGFLIASILSGTMTSLQKTILTRWNVSLATKVAANVLQKMLLLPIEFYSQRFPGEVAYRMTLVDSIAENITKSLFLMLLNCLLVVIYGVVLLSYSPIITLVVLTGTAINILAMVLVYRAREDSYARYQADISTNNALSLAGLQSFETIKATGSEFNFFSKWVESYTKVVNDLQQIGIKDIFIGVISPILYALTMIAILGVSIVMIIEGKMTVGTFMALRIIAGLFMGPFYELIDFAKIIQLLKVDLLRLKDITSFKEDTLIESQIAAEHKTKVSPSSYNSKLSGQVEVNNLTFSFSERDPPILKGIFLNLKPGQTIALVGPTGSGKSTIAKIIAGIHTNFTGKVLFDGMPIFDIPRSNYLRSVGIVEQDPFLFEGTARENITMFNTLIPELEIIRAAQDAVIHEDILARDGEYGMYIAENGKNLSGGQCQRMEVARALVRNPSILILDEATSALDVNTENMLMKNLRKRGITTLFVAHRLSTIRNCDQILVMDDGTIIANGTHDELLAVPGLYRDLFESDKVK